MLQWREKQTGRSHIIIAAILDNNNINLKGAKTKH
jgi:hypothetical protein